MKSEFQFRNCFELESTKSKLSFTAAAVSTPSALIVSRMGVEMDSPPPSSRGIEIFGKFLYDAKGIDKQIIG